MISYYILEPEQIKYFEQFLPLDMRNKETDDRFWFILAADDIRGPVGMSVIDSEESAPRIVSVGVSKEFTHMHIGRELVERSCGILKESGAICVFADVNSSNAAMVNLLNSTGFEIFDKIPCYSVSLENLAKSSLLSRPSEKTARIKVVEELDSVLWNNFIHKVQNILGFTKLEKENFDNHYSYVITNKSETSIEAAIFLKPTRDGIEFYWAYSNQENNDKAVLLVLMQYVFSVLYREFDSDTYLKIAAVNSISIDLIKFFVKDINADITILEYVRML